MMRPRAKWIIGGLLAPFSFSVVFALGLLIWGTRYFPIDIEAPDASRLPPVVVQGFSKYFEADRDAYATRLFLSRQRTTLSQREFNLAAYSARLWLLVLWSPPQRLAEIAAQAHFGHGFVGIENAARGYFGRPPDALSREEVAALALLTRSPSSLSPWCHPEELLQSASRVFVFAGLQPNRVLEHLLIPPAGACLPISRDR